jgi:hypothetical protein
MRTGCLIFIFILISTTNFAQSKDTIQYGNYFAKQKEKKDSWIFGTEMGMWIPIGNLSHHMIPNINTGLGIGHPIHRFRIDLYLNFYFPMGYPKEFNYYLPDTSLLAKPVVNKSFRLQVSKPIVVYRKIVLEGLFGMGVHGIDTNLQIPDSVRQNAKNKDRTYYQVSTLLLTTGVKFRHRRLGINVQFNCIPQNLFYQQVVNDFGNYSFTYSIFYKFF